MNKHILLVMKWLDNPESVTEEELWHNSESASADYGANVYVAAAAFKAWFVYGADTTAYHHALIASAANAVTHYFETTDEDKQDYLEELNK